MSARPLFRVSRSYREQARDSKWLSLKNRIWVWIAFAVGFFARVHELDTQSLWNDEGTSVALARTNIPAIVNAAARDIHPPLYYLLLSGWIQGAGISEFAVRFLSVLAGVAVIAVTFRIAREFFDQDVAVIAAVLAALNPFQTYYAQETRMYIWVTLFATLSVWMFVLMFKPPREFNPPLSAHRRRVRLIAVAGYVLFTLAALYTNYYAFTIVLFENLAFMAWLVLEMRAGRPHTGHALAFWIVAQVVIVLAYVPWLVFAQQSLTAWPGISEPMSLLEMAQRILSAFATAADSPLDYQAPLVAVYALFFVGGLLPSRDLFKQRLWGIITCASWTLVPLLAMYFVSLSRAAYNPKFLLLATPGFLICVARGVSVLYPGLFLRERTPEVSLGASLTSRLARQYAGIGKLFVGALFAAGMVLALQNLYDDPRLRRDNYRGIVNYINAVATERDAVIVNAPGQLDVVRYYYRSPARLVGLPVGRPMQIDATRAVLDELATRDTIFGIFWATEQADPEQFIERRLAQTTYKASDEWRGNVRLAEYVSAGVPEMRAFQSGVQFGDEIQLSRYRYPAPSQPVTGFVPIELEWSPLHAPPSTHFKVFAQLLDAQGHLVSQRDSEPQDGYYPTSQWNAGETVIDRLAIPIPPGLAPGEYRVIVGLYRGDTGERLRASSRDDFLLLGSVQVPKKIYPRDAFFFARQLNVSLGEIEVSGYEIEPRGQDSYPRGGLIPLVLYFYAHEQPVRDLALEVQLRDRGGSVIASSRAFASYPTSHWDRDEIVREAHSLVVPSDAAPGEYKIVLASGTQVIDVVRVQVR